jgi:preprotein translocase subunit SecF
MIQLIIFIIFILSLAGIIFISYRKIPELIDLAESPKTEFAKPKSIAKLEHRIKKISEIFQKHVLLHKFLFSVKCIVSKTEHRIDNWLHNIRKKAQQKQNKK